MSRLLALLLLAGLAPLAGTVPLRAAEKDARPALYPVLQAFDVRYHAGSGRQTLDVFFPKGKASERFPVVLFVHGGTWMFGDKNFFGLYRRVGRNLARHGIVTVLINYRLSPVVKHPEHVKDVARAFAWTVRHIDRYAGDPDRIILAGHSAGGHLAALLATDESYLKAPALKLTDRQRKGLRGVVALSGVYRVPQPEEFRAMSARIVRTLVGDPSKSSSAMLLTPLLKEVAEIGNPFALVFGTSADVHKRASPLTHVHKGLPPFLLMTAEYEVPRLADMAEDFSAALRKAGNKAELKEINGCSHHNIVKQLHTDTSEVTRRVLAFVKQYAAAERTGS